AGLFRAWCDARRAVLGLDLVPVAAGVAGRAVQRPSAVAARRRPRNCGYQQPRPHPGGAAGADVLSRSAIRLTVGLRGAMLAFGCFGGLTTPRDPALA